MSVITIVGVVGIVVYVIGRQLMGEPLRGKRVLVLPAVLFIVGIAEVASYHGQHPGSIDIVLLAIGAAIAVVVGVWQGRSMRLEARQGYLWGQMPVRSMWLWAALLASRGMLDGLGYAFGARVATGSAAILLTLGINRLAQAAVMFPRALAAGVPFSPEKDGTSLFSGIFSAHHNGGPDSTASLSRFSDQMRNRTASSRLAESDRSANNLSRQDWGLLLRQIMDRLNDRTR